MGFITHQWLQGGRSYSPVEVTLSVSRSSDDWSQRNKVEVEIQAKRQGGNYQTIYFTTADLHSVLPKLMAAADPNDRFAIAAETLQKADDETLVNLLEKVFSARSKEKAEKAEIETDFIPDPLIEDDSTDEGDR